MGFAVAAKGGAPDDGGAIGRASVMLRQWRNDAGNLEPAGGFPTPNELVETWAAETLQRQVAEGKVAPWFAAAMGAGFFGKATDDLRTPPTAKVLSKDLTYLYQKLGPNGEHLKYGIAKDPATRYTQEELGGGRLKILTSGSRQDMLRLERNLHETLPIGREEGQKFYIQKQIDRGYVPPPYAPSAP